jgi:predicted ATPase
MFLSRFRVRGYKCLHDVDLALRPFHVVCGPTGSGKSSLLEAIAALLGRLKVPSSSWFPPTGNMLSLVEHGSPSPTIDLLAEWSELVPGSPPSMAPLAAFGYSIVPPPRGKTLGVMDQWIRPRAADAEPPSLARMPTSFPRRTSPELAEDLMAQSAFRNYIQKALQPATIYRLTTAGLSAPAVDLGQGLTLESDGLGLPVVLDILRSDWPDRYQALVAAYIELFPQYVGFEFAMEPTPADRRRKTPPPMLKTLLFHTAAAQVISATHVAGTALLVLGYLVLAQLSEPPGPLLIENPESGLPLERLTQVLLLLRRSTFADLDKPGTQVIVTTHSPQVIECAGDGELSRMVGDARP